MNDISAMLSPTVLDLDPFDEDVLGDPDRFDHVALEGGPVLYFPQYDLYALSRYREVRAAFTDWRRFCSGHGTGLAHIGREGNWRKPSLVLESDPPRHSIYRKILLSVLVGETLAEIEERFAPVADAMVQRLVAQEAFDAQVQLADAFPLEVVPAMLGLDPSDRDVMLVYSDLNFNSMGPDNALRQASVSRAQTVVTKVGELCRRDSLEPGGLGDRIYAECERQGLPDEDAAVLVRTFFSASMDTTANSIGFTIHSLASNPDQWTRVKADPAAVERAYDEALRHRAPSPHIGRTTTEAVEIAGVTIPADSKVLLLIGAANRDPARFEDPNTFDLAHEARTHVAFGAGIHACVGQPLARLEARLVLSALRKHAATLKVAGDPTYRLNNWLRGFDRLPIRATAESAPS